MTPRDILDEAKEVTGSCSDSVNLAAINRAVQLLANEGLFDPMIGYLTFNANGNNYLALPREVKTPLRINIDGSPSMFRTRLFEFTPNSNGSEEGDRLDFSWDDRGFVCVQDEKKLPGTLAYKCALSADAGKTATVEGRLQDGTRKTVVLVAAVSAPTHSDDAFYEILSVRREETQGGCTLCCGASEGVIGQYYGDEVEPSYRVVRLSKAVASVRMIFRKHTPEIRALDDVIPLHSAMAVIHAAKAVRLYQQDEYDKGDAALARAIAFLKKEQDARDEAASLAQVMDSPSITDSTLTTRDGIVVADVYDEASDIFGPIGRDRLFDKITTAIEILSNKASWDSRVGVVDIVTSDRSDAFNVRGRKGHGYFTLPRYVETPISINLEGEPMTPRNRWFEFHLNGPGERETSSVRMWDDCGETCLAHQLPRGEDGRALPVKIVAVPDNSLDDGAQILAYGFEQLDDGSEAEVYRNGAPGWAVPCSHSSLDPGAGAPKWTRIERIVKPATKGFVRLVTITETLVPGTPEIPESTTVTYETDSGLTLTLLDSDFAADAISADLVLDDNPDTGFATGNATTTNPDASYDGDLVSPYGGAVVFSIFGQDPAFSIGGYTGSGGVHGDFTRHVTTDPGSPAVPDSYAYAEADTIGFYYPDEVEPKYRLIKLDNAKAKRIRVLYRKRALKVASLHDPIPLRSRQALVNMMRAVKLQETDAASAEALEAKAVQYLSEERINSGPSDSAILQFDENSMPGMNYNVM